MLLVHILKAVFVGVIIVAATGRREHSRLHVALEFVQTEDVQERRLGGWQVELMRVGQFESRRRRSFRHEIDWLVGE